MSSPPMRHYAIVWAMLAILLLSACTRERAPWPTSTPFSAASPVPIPATPTPDATVLPALTPHVTTSASDAQPGTSATRPADAVLPMPGNEDLTPKPPTPTPTPVLFTYQVQAGDSLYSIAAEFNVSVEAIRQHNQLANPNTLRVGQTLQIPGEAPPGTSTGAGYVHVVERGETLFGIAQQYGVPLDALANANSITNPSTIRVGQRLLIPTINNVPQEEREVRAHIVQPGETLYAIAAKYGVTPAAIVAANQLSDPNKIVSGQRLIIP